MFFKFVAVAALAVCALAEAKEGCVAQAVTDLSVNADNTLTWNVSKNEKCDITQFLVHVQKDGVDKYGFSVTANKADISFLTSPEEYTFVVEAISSHTKGRSQSIVSAVPKA